MRKDTAEHIAYAESIGWTNEGFDGRGHYVLTHPDAGEALHIAATPSDYRSQLNERARMRRLAGVKNDGPAAAKYKGVSRKRAIVKHQPPEVVAKSVEANRLIADHQRLCKIIADAQADTAKGDLVWAAIALLPVVESALKDLDRQIPLRTFRTYQEDQ